MNSKEREDLLALEEEISQKKAELEKVQADLAQMNTYKNEVSFQRKQESIRKNLEALIVLDINIATSEFQFLRQSVAAKLEEHIKALGPPSE